MRNNDNLVEKASYSKDELVKKYEEFSSLHIDRVRHDGKQFVSIIKNRYGRSPADIKKSVVIAGPIATGKSALALAYVFDLKDKYKNIRWLDFRNVHTEDEANERLEEFKQEARQFNSYESTCLLVLDNVFDNTLIDSFLKRFNDSFYIHILITSTCATWPKERALIIPLTAYTPDEVDKVLKIKYPMSGRPGRGGFHSIEKTKNPIEEVFKNLEYLPLLLRRYITNKTVRATNFDLVNSLIGMSVPAPDLCTLSYLVRFEIFLKNLIAYHPKARDFLPVLLGVRFCTAVPVSLKIIAARDSEVAAIFTGYNLVSLQPLHLKETECLNLTLQRAVALLKPDDLKKYGQNESTLREEIIKALYKFMNSFTTKNSELDPDLDCYYPVHEFHKVEDHILNLKLSDEDNEQVLFMLLILYIKASYLYLRVANIDNAKHLIEEAEKIIGKIHDDSLKKLTLEKYIQLMKAKIHFRCEENEQAKKIVEDLILKEKEQSTVGYMQTVIGFVTTGKISTKRTISKIEIISKVILIKILLRIYKLEEASIQKKILLKDLSACKVSAIADGFGKLVAGKYYFHVKQYDLAEQYFIEAYDAFRMHQKNGPVNNNIIEISIHMSKASYWRAEASRVLGKKDVPEKLAKVMSDLEKLYPAVANHRYRIRCIISLGKYYFFQGSLLMAKTKLEEALQLIDIKDKKEASQSTGNNDKAEINAYLGLIASEQAFYKDAQDKMKKALQYWQDSKGTVKEELPDKIRNQLSRNTGIENYQRIFHPNFAKTIRYLGLNYFRQGEYAIAVSLYKEVIIIDFKEYSYDYDFLHEENDDGLHKFVLNKVVPIYKRNANAKAALVIRDLAYVDFQCGHYEDAKDKLLALLSIQEITYKDSPDHYEIRDTKKLLANVYIAMSELDQAERIIKQRSGKDSKIYTDVSLLYCMAELNYYQGNIKGSLQNLEEAEQLLKLMISSQGINEKTPERVQILTLKSKINLDLGYYNQAAKDIEQAKMIHFSVLCNRHPLCALIYFVQGDIVLAKKDFRSAATYYNDKIRYIIPALYRPHSYKGTYYFIQLQLRRSWLTYQESVYANINDSDSNQRLNPIFTLKEYVTDESLAYYYKIEIQSILIQELIRKIVQKEFLSEELNAIQKSIISYIQSVKKSVEEKWRETNKQLQLYTGWLYTLEDLIPIKKDFPSDILRELIELLKLIINRYQLMVDKKHERDSLLLGKLYIKLGLLELNNNIKESIQFFKKAKNIFSKIQNNELDSIEPFISYAKILECHASEKLSIEENQELIKAQVTDVNASSQKYARIEDVRQELRVLENFHKKNPHNIYWTALLDSAQEIASDNLLIAKENFEKPRKTEIFYYSSVVSHIPEVEKNFYPRDTQLQNILANLNREKICIVMGVSGSGKTQLLAKYIETTKTEGLQVIWTNANSENAIYVSFRDWASSNIPDSEFLADNELLENIKHYLKEQKNIYLVFDGVKDLFKLDELFVKIFGATLNLVLNSHYILIALQTENNTFKNYPYNYEKLRNPEKIAVKLIGSSGTIPIVSKLTSALKDYYENTLKKKNFPDFKKIQDIINFWLEEFELEDWEAQLWLVLSFFYCGSIDYYLLEDILSFLPNKASLTQNIIKEKLDLYVKLGILIPDRSKQKQSGEVSSTIDKNKRYRIHELVQTALENYLLNSDYRDSKLELFEVAAKVIDKHLSLFDRRNYDPSVNDKISRNWLHALRLLYVSYINRDFISNDLLRIRLFVANYCLFHIRDAKRVINLLDFKTILEEDLATFNLAPSNPVSPVSSKDDFILLQEYNLLAYAYFVQAKYVTAYEYIKKVQNILFSLRKNKTHVDAIKHEDGFVRFTFAKIQHEANRSYEKAKSELEKILAELQEINGDSHKYDSDIGAVQYEIGKAITAMAIQLEETEGDARDLFDQAQRAYDNSIASLRILGNLHPLTIRSKLGKAYVLAVQGRVDEANEYLENFDSRISNKEKKELLIIANNINSAQKYLILALIEYDKNENYQKALDYVDTAILLKERYEPNEYDLEYLVEAYFLKGRILLYKGFYELAIKAFEKAKELIIKFRSEPIAEVRNVSGIFSRIYKAIASIFKPENDNRTKNDVDLFLCKIDQKVIVCRLHLKSVFSANDYTILKEEIEYLQDFARRNKIDKFKNYAEIYLWQLNLRSEGKESTTLSEFERNDNTCNISTSDLFLEMLIEQTKAEKMFIEHKYHEALEQYKLAYEIADKLLTKREKFYQSFHYQKMAECAYKSQQYIKSINFYQTAIQIFQDSHPTTIFSHPKLASLFFAIAELFVASNSPELILIALRLLTAAEGIIDELEAITSKEISDRRSISINEYLKNEKTYDHLLEFSKNKYLEVMKQEISDQQINLVYSPEQLVDSILGLVAENYKSFFPIEQKIVESPYTGGSSGSVDSPGTNEIFNLPNTPVPVALREKDVQPRKSEERFLLDAMAESSQSPQSIVSNSKLDIKGEKVMQENIQSIASLPSGKLKLMQLSIFTSPFLLDEFIEKIKPNLIGHKDKLLSVITNDATIDNSSELDKLFNGNRQFYDDIDEYGNTLLHYACLVQNQPLIRYLLETQKFNTIKTNQWGLAPVHLVALNSNEEIINIFKEYGVDDTPVVLEHEGAGDVSCNSLALAILYASPKTITALLEKGETNFQINGIGNLLHLAVLANRRDVLQALLHHAPISTNRDLINQPYHSVTPLILAATSGQTECLEELLKCDFVKVDEINDYGQTALHAAAALGLDEAVEVLLEKMDVNILDRSNRTAHAVAENELRKLNEKNNLTSDEVDLKSRLQIVMNICSNFSKRKRAHGEAAQKTKMRRMKIENLVFQGGGPKGIAYVGALKELENQQKLNSVKRVAGTSAGAITALGVALGLSSSEIEEILDEKDLSTLLEGAFDPNSSSKLLTLVSAWKAARKDNPSVWDYVHPWRTLSKFEGFCIGAVFREWIENIIRKKLNRDGVAEEISNNLTFGELRTLINAGKSYKHLFVVATKISRDGNTEPCVISSMDLAYDDVIISDAISASMSIPGVFVPHHLFRKQRISNGAERREFSSDRFLDGGLLYNFPLDIFDKKQFASSSEKLDPNAFVVNENTLGFSLYTPSETPEFIMHETSAALDRASKEKSNVRNLFESIALTFYNAEILLRRNMRSDDEKRTIAVSNEGIKLLQFNLTKEDKDKLIAAGIKAVQEKFALSITKDVAASNLKIQLFSVTDPKKAKSKHGFNWKSNEFTMKIPPDAKSILFSTPMKEQKFELKQGNNSSSEKTVILQDIEPNTEIPLPRGSVAAGQTLNKVYIKATKSLASCTIFASVHKSDSAGSSRSKPIAGPSNS